MSSVVVEIVVRDDDGKAKEMVTFGYIPSGDRYHDQRVAKAVGNSVREWMYNNVPKKGDADDRGEEAPDRGKVPVS